MVRGGSEGALDAALWEAVRPGCCSGRWIYWFLHDRVQEAAYALIPEGERAAEHLRIGRLLAAGTPPDAIEESVFEIVSQLNRGAALITAAEEREQLAGLNLLAGRRAKASTAYASALTYLTTGVALLPDNAWERRPELAFALALHRAECEFLTGALMERRRARRTRKPCHEPPRPGYRHPAAGGLVMALGQSDRAVAVGLDYLRRIGIVWSAHPTQEEVRQEYARIWRQLGDRPIEALLNLPRMADPVACGTMDVSPRSCRRPCSPTRTCAASSLAGWGTSAWSTATATRRALRLHRGGHRAGPVFRRLQGRVPLRPART